MAVWIDSRIPRTGLDSAPVRVEAGASLDHLADVVMKLDQVDEDRPLDLQEKVLLVFLKLGMQPIDHPLAGRLRADSRSKVVCRACRAAGPIDRSTPGWHREPTRRRPGARPHRRDSRSWSARPPMTSRRQPSSAKPAMMSSPGSSSCRDDVASGRESSRFSVPDVGSSQAGSFSDIVHPSALVISAVMYSPATVRC